MQTIDNNFIDKHCLWPDLKLFEYQYEAVKVLFGKNRFLLGDDPGLGKTIELVVAVNLIQHFSKEPLRVLVFGTKSIVINWQREVAKWSTGKAEYTITNHDKLVGSNSSKLMTKWDIVIGDESHFYLKNEDAMRCKVFQQLIVNAERVWLSTATPASKCASDYYVTLRIIIPKLFEKWSLNQFKRRYCEKIADPFAYNGYRYAGFNEETLKELNQIFKVAALGRKQEDVKKDLPPLTFSEYFVDAPDAETFSTQEMEDMTKRIFEGVELSVHYQNILKRNALKKIPSVIELLNTYPAKKKLVLFIWHQDVADKLVEEIRINTGRTVDMITGQVTSEVKRQNIIDKFQTGDLDTLVLNMQSGGVGINLTAASTGIYVQFPTVATLWIQSLKRIHRIGSKDPVQIIKAMIPNSVDEKVFEVLTKRLDYVEQVGLQSRGTHVEHLFDIATGIPLQAPDIFGEG